MGDAPRKPTLRGPLPSAPGLPRVQLPPLSSTVPQSDRDEFLLRVLKDQTSEIIAEVESLRTETQAQNENFDRRILDLEKSALEDARTRLAVQTLITKVDLVLSNDRSQEQDIGALKDRVAIAVRPAVEAAASAEGQLSGKQAGNRQGKLWGVVTVLAGIVVSATMHYCQEQITNYGQGTTPAKVAAPH